MTRYDAGSNYIDQVAHAVMGIGGFLAQGTGLK